MKHQSLLYGIIIILVGVVIIQFGNTKPNEYVVGPSQKEIDRIEKELIKSEQLRVEQVFQVMQEKKADSIRFIQTKTKSTTEIKALKSTVVNLRAKLYGIRKDSLMDKVDSLQEQIIDQQHDIIIAQDKQLYNDSTHIVSMYDNFNEQMELHAQEVKYLNERLKLKDSEIARKDATIKRKNRSGVVKVGIIVGLVALLAL